MNTTISQTVDQWIEKESQQSALALKVIRQNDPWQDMPEEEIEDRSDSESVLEELDPEEFTLRRKTWPGRR